jgi:hypothetical protein
MNWEQSPGSQQGAARRRRGAEAFRHEESRDGCRDGRTRGAQAQRESGVLDDFAGTGGTSGGGNGGSEATHDGAETPLPMRR